MRKTAKLVTSCLAAGLVASVHQAPRLRASTAKKTRGLPIREAPTHSFTGLTAQASRVASYQRRAPL